MHQVGHIVSATAWKVNDERRLVPARMMENPQHRVRRLPLLELEWQPNGALSPSRPSMRIRRYQRNSSGSLAIFAAILRASSLVSSLAANPISLARFCYYCPRRRPSGSKAMEWFKRKTSIVGYEISNWIIVLGAIIIVLLVFQNLH